MDNLPIVRPEAPTSPGCWRWFPSGCPNHKYNPKYQELEDPTVWTRTNFKGASESKQKCDDEEAAIRKWCGVSDIVLIYN